MPLQHLQLLAVLQTDDVVAEHRLLDRHRRLRPLRLGRLPCRHRPASCRLPGSATAAHPADTALFDTCAETICAVSPRTSVLPAASAIRCPFRLRKPLRHIEVGRCRFAMDICGLKKLASNMTDKPAADQELDITAEVCPMTFVRTRLALDRMAPGRPCWSGCAATSRCATCRAPRASRGTRCCRWRPTPTASPRCCCGVAAVSDHERFMRSTSASRRIGVVAAPPAHLDEAARAGRAPVRRRCRWPPPGTGRAAAPPTCASGGAQQRRGEAAPPRRRRDRQGQHLRLVRRDARQQHAARADRSGRTRRAARAAARSRPRPRPRAAGTPRRGSPPAPPHGATVAANDHPTGGGRRPPAGSRASADRHTAAARAAAATCAGTGVRPPRRRDAPAAGGHRSA